MEFQAGNNNGQENQSSPAIIQRTCGEDLSGTAPKRRSGKCRTA